MGHSKRGAKKNRGTNTRDSTNNNDNGDDYVVDEEQSTEEPSAESVLQLPSGGEVKVNTGNPRISPDEKWTCHTNKDMMRRLFEILMTYYPSRLCKIFVVKGRGKNHYYRDQIQGRMMLRKLLSEIDKENYEQIMTKTRFVTKTSELTQNVALKDLPSFVGGIAPIHPSAYEFYEFQSL